MVEINLDADMRQVSQRLDRDGKPFAPSSLRTEQSAVPAELKEEEEEVEV